MDREYVGIDLHRRSATVYTMSGEGEVRIAQRRGKFKARIAVARKLPIKLIHDEVMRIVGK